MKKITNIAIGGKSFIITEEAYENLSLYLGSFESMLNLERGKSEVMDDLEERIAELFSEATIEAGTVVDTHLVREVILQLGMPDGSTPNPEKSVGEGASTERSCRKFYRDPDGKKIGGVCSGLAYYVNLDVTLIRIAAFVLTCAYGAGFLCYILLWIIAPIARTPVQKCEMHGVPPTAANLYKYSKK